MPDSLSDEFRGVTPPDRDDDWSINTVARRALVLAGDGDREAECDVTGETIPMHEYHLLVNLRRPGRPQPDVETVIVRDEETLREWVDDA